MNEELLDKLIDGDWIDGEEFREYKEDELEEMRKFWEQEEAEINEKEETSD